MVRKKKTKPVIPGKKKTALILAKIRLFRYSNRYATLWEAATEFIKTKHFKVLVKAALKNKSRAYILNFMNFRDVYGNEFRINKTQRQIKFVENMYRDIKKEDATQYPKTLHQTNKTGFTPPKNLINLTKELDKKGKAKPNKYRLELAKRKRNNKRPLKERLREKKDFKAWIGPQQK